MQATKKNLIFALLICLFLIADQITKQIVILQVSYTNSVPIIDEFIYLTPLKNQGIIFGFFPSFPYLTAFLTICLIIISIYALVAKTKKKSKLGISLIIAGTAGNLGDRIFRGGVIDFINMRFWPIFNLAFNLADGFIVAGGIFIYLSLILLRENA